MLRGIFDGGGLRKQNGHWQSSKPIPRGEEILFEFPYTEREFAGWDSYTARDLGCFLYGDAVLLPGNKYHFECLARVRTTNGTTNIDWQPHAPGPSMYNLGQYCLYNNDILDSTRRISNPYWDNSYDDVSKVAALDCPVHSGITEDNIVFTIYNYSGDKFFRTPSSSHISGNFSYSYSYDVEVKKAISVHDQIYTYPVSYIRMTLGPGDTAILGYSCKLTRV